MSMLKTIDRLSVTFNGATCNYIHSILECPEYSNFFSSGFVVKLVFLKGKTVITIYRLCNNYLKLE